MKRFLIISVMFICVAACGSNDAELWTKTQNISSDRKIESILAVLDKYGIINEAEGLDQYISQLEHRTDSASIAELNKWQNFKKDILEFFDELQNYNDTLPRNIAISRLKMICEQVGITLPPNIQKFDINKYVPIDVYNREIQWRDSALRSKDIIISSQEEIIKEERRKRQISDSLYHQANNLYIKERKINQILRDSIEYFRKTIYELEQKNNKLEQEIKTAKRNIDKIKKEKESIERELNKVRNAFSQSNIEQRKQESDINLDEYIKQTKDYYFKNMVKDMTLMVGTKGKVKKAKALKISFMLDANSDFYPNSTIKIYFRIVKSSSDIIVGNSNFDYEGKNINSSWMEEFNFTYGRTTTSSIEIKKKTMEEGLFSLDAYALIDNKMIKIGCNSYPISRKKNPEFFKE